MQYRGTEKVTEKISLLGYGCMRFSRKAGFIDQEKAERELNLAIERGVTYFDTAYTYGGSEEALGKYITHSGNRERMLIATKVPHYTCTSIDDFERIFNEQLARLNTDYVDFYLMHMLTSLESWERCVKIGVPEWIAQKKESGQIRHFGFSYHGGREDFIKIIDAYDWDIAQIQLNYLDAGSQAGLDGLFYAAARGIGIIIMEPLRGGKLANNLPPGAKHVFQQANKARAQAGKQELSFAQWGLQWLFDLPEVTCVLSGMNSIEQIEENCFIAESTLPHSLSATDDAAYDAAITEIRAVEKIPCTGCGYCMPCAKGIDIPTCFRNYNLRYSEGWMSGFKTHMMTVALAAEPKSASNCIKCVKCAKRCPQYIDIPTEMENVAKMYEGIIYRGVQRFKGLYWKS